MVKVLMGKRLLLISVAVLLVNITLIGCRQDEETLPPEGEITEIATNFVYELTEEKFEDAAERFNGEMKEAMPNELLAQTWTQLETQVGAFVSVEGFREETIQEYDVVFVTSQFENALIDVRVVFDEDKRIAGLFFEPAAEQSMKDWKAPEYIDRQDFREEEVSFGEEPWVISGTLTIPEGAGPHPAVILIHGSGPSDRDSTIGPNKPLKDIAEGLSTSGIAVLRYDKRTYTYQRALSDTPEDFTVHEETMDDAFEAIAFLKTHGEIDAEQLFLAGHSLGGMLAPRVAEESGDLRGLILLAAPARPMGELILMQTEYLVEHEEQHNEEVVVGLEELRQQVERIQDPNLSIDTPMDETLGIPAAYWLDLQQYDSLEIAKSLNIPMMILQGDRDYQVTMEDFKMWQEALDNNSEVSFHSYKDANHLFMQGEGLSLPDEYYEANHVDQAVINDIITWIKTEQDRGTE